jgi:hypothetical protein
MNSPVIGYALEWSVALDKGFVDLQVRDPQGRIQQGQIPVNSAEELAAVADILRSSHEVFFESEGQVLRTVFKAPGTV